MQFMIPVWPDGGATQKAASALKALKGVTVAFVDDNFDVPFTEEVEHHLRETYGAIVKRLVKPWASAASPAALIEEAAQSQVAIVGVAL